MTTDARQDLFTSLIELETAIRRARAVANAQVYGMEIEGGLPFDDLADLTAVIADTLAEAQQTVERIREQVLPPAAA